MHSNTSCLAASAHTQDIDAFVTGAMETLSSRPESIDEVGEANVKHGELQETKPNVITYPVYSVFLSFEGI